MRNIRTAPAFTLGTDSTTTILGGLSKHCDLWIRLWSSVTNRVTDAYIDTHEFGHEPADKQVRFFTVVLIFVIINVEEKF